MAAAAEASSEHPLARAVLAYARSCLRAASSTLDLGSQGASSSSHAVFHGNSCSTGHVCERPYCIPHLSAQLLPNTEPSVDNMRVTDSLALPQSIEVPHACHSKSHLGNWYHPSYSPSLSSDLTCRAGEPSDGEEDDAEGLRNTAWIRRAHNAEALAGRGVRCWVEPAAPLASVGLQPSQVRVLVGNRALMADEGVPVSRRVFIFFWNLHLYTLCRYRLCSSCLHGLPF